MLISDAHCDTLSRIYDAAPDNTEVQLRLFAKSGFHVDAERLGTRPALQILAAFARPGTSWDRLRALLECARLCIASSNSYALCLNSADIKAAVGSGRTAFVLAVENAGEVLDRRLARLHELYGMGVRLLGLAWNSDNAFCGGALGDGSGLTPYGFECLRTAGAMGMVLDVSHMSEASFWDCLRRSRYMVVASHSNLRVLQDNPRNLSNAQLRALSAQGGLTGICFHTPMLGTGASIETVYRHIEMAVHIGGSHAVCFGSDFDGTEQLPNGIRGTESLTRLVRGLTGVLGNATEQVAGLNLLRVLE